METKPIPIVGSKSVYCINEEQMAEANRIVDSGGKLALKVKGYIQQIEVNLTRNEQAALAFKIIEHLRSHSAK